jgi:hypothetical protein
MHSIDPKWTNLAAGYQAIQLLQARMESEFGRAVQAGYRYKIRRELTEWQKKRRIFFVMAALAPLSVITLCLTAFYHREAACLIAYWIILVVIILITLAVAGRNYIREMIDRPNPDQAETRVVDLEQRWWARLSPDERLEGDPQEKAESDFLAMLGQSLPDTCLAIRNPGLLLTSPAGLWIFQIQPWSGTIIRQDGDWKMIQPVRDKLVQKRIQEQVIEPAPDEVWLQRKNDLANILRLLPRLSWTECLIQGGVVFTHPKVILDKTSIQGNTAAFGRAKAWVERLRGAPAVGGFSLEIQLEILDALHADQEKSETSAEEEAERLYQTAADEVRQSIVKIVG